MSICSSSYLENKLFEEEHSVSFVSTLMSFLLPTADLDTQQMFVE